MVGFLSGFAEFLVTSKGAQQFHCYTSGLCEKTHRGAGCALSVKVQVLTAGPGTSLSNAEPLAHRLWHQGTIAERTSPECSVLRLRRGLV